MLDGVGRMAPRELAEVAQRVAAVGRRDEIEIICADEFVAGFPEHPAVGGIDLEQGSVRGSCARGFLVPVEKALAPGGFAVARGEGLPQCGAQSVKRIRGFVARRGSGCARGNLFGQSRDAADVGAPQGEPDKAEQEDAAKRAGQGVGAHGAQGQTRGAVITTDPDDRKRATVGTADPVPSLDRLQSRKVAWIGGWDGGFRGKDVEKKPDFAQLAEAFFSRSRH